MIFFPAGVERIAATLCDLIAIKSLSGQEAEIATYIETFLRHAGLKPQRDDQDNVVLVIEPLTPGDPEKNTLHFSGHTDTVIPVDGWTADPWTPRQSDTPAGRRIAGLGASDMKAGLATMLHLARHFAAHRLPRLRLVFSFTVCEEGPAAGKSNGVHHVLENFPGRWAITTEASCDAQEPAIALGCQGHAKVTLALKGRAAHSANPDRGLNAIHAAAKICERVELLNRSFPEIPVFENVHARAAAAVTLIRGGAAMNIIPENCELTVSRRLAPGETVEKIETEMAELAANLNGVSATWKVRCEAPACVVDTHGSLLRAASEASQALFGRRRYAWNRARTDIVLFKQAGLDVLNIGPGCSGQPHVADEYMHVSDLLSAGNLLAETALRLDRRIDE